MISIWIKTTHTRTHARTIKDFTELQKNIQIYQQHNTQVQSQTKLSSLLEAEKGNSVQT